MAIIDLGTDGPRRDPPHQVSGTVDAQNEWNNADGVRLRRGKAFAMLSGTITTSTPSLQVLLPGTGETWKTVYVFTSPFTTAYEFTVSSPEALYRLGTPTGGHGGSDSYTATIFQQN